MTEERRLTGIWNAERILKEYISLADDRGQINNIDLSDDSPYSIRIRRFAAAMKAYGKEEGLYFGIDHIISETYSEDKISELCVLLKQNLHDEYSLALANSDLIKQFHARQDLFETFFRYRKSLCKVENIWAGIMECSFSISLGIRASTNLNRTYIKAASDVVDKMLVLLIGDDYDKSFSEEELLPFGYPDVTDSELQEMIYDNF